MHTGLCIFLAAYFMSPVALDVAALNDIDTTSAVTLLGVCSSVITKTCSWVLVRTAPLHLPFQSGSGSEKASTHVSATLLFIAR